MTADVSGWLHMDDIKGGVVVFCTLCGRKLTRRWFVAADTNYAEARRLATAYHWQHEHSEIHKAATEAYHSDEAPTIDSQDQILCEVFNTPLPSERDLRRKAARVAALRQAQADGSLPSGHRLKRVGRSS